MRLVGQCEDDDGSRFFHHVCFIIDSPDGEDETVYKDGGGEVKGTVRSSEGSEGRSVDGYEEGPERGTSKPSGGDGGGGRETSVRSVSKKGTATESESQAMERHENGRSGRTLLNRSEDRPARVEDQQKQKRGEGDSGNGAGGKGLDYKLPKYVRKSERPMEGVGKGGSAEVNDKAGLSGGSNRSSDDLPKRAGEGVKMEEDSGPWSRFAVEDLQRKCESLLKELEKPLYLDEGETAGEDYSETGDYKWNDFISDAPDGHGSAEILEDGARPGGVLQTRVHSKGAGEGWGYRGNRWNINR